MASTSTSTSTSINRIQFTNITDKETIYQRCLLVIGTCHDYASVPAPGAVEDFIAVKARDALHQPLGQQNWPVSQGTFRCLVMLQPGANRVEFQLHHRGQTTTSARLTVLYQPLLQLPPLHLAILVAKDSPLLIDCPPAKRGAISTAHGTLDAAVLKLRMAAYMWQAMTAEDLRAKGLGRRCFRLDEEWGVDTTTLASSYLQSEPGSSARMMGSVAKVHVVRSEKTVAELRDADENRRVRHRRELQTCFEQALTRHGHPFVGTTRPVVAGMFLDSHYSVEQGAVLAHVALGFHRSTGVSHAVYGSHTTYAWPRFLEEVPACLLDLTPTGDTVGHDTCQCATMRDACFVGQGAMLEQVGYAFGKAPPTDALSKGCIKDWGRVFVAQKGSENHEAKWELMDALRIIATNEHFRLPGDRALSRSQKESNVVIRCALDQNDEPLLEISSKAGLARIQFLDPSGKVVWEVDFCRKTTAEHQQQDDEMPIKAGPAIFHLSVPELEGRLDRSQPSSLEVLAMNGCARKAQNVWMLLADQPFLKVPGTSLVLSKRSVRAPALDGSESSQPYWRWAMLLKRKHQQGGGRLTHASRIDIRIGATMDGAVVYYADGSKCNCGRANQAHYGGHQAEARSLSEDEVFDISRISLNKAGSWGSLHGCRSKQASTQASKQSHYFASPHCIYHVSS